MSDKQKYDKVEKLAEAGRDSQREVAKQIGISGTGIGKNTTASGAQAHQGNLTPSSGVSHFQRAAMEPKNMASYKLTYFNLTGLGEPIRFMLSYLGEEFEDNRLTQDEWPSIKPSMPFGKVPLLELDGKLVHQSTAISRYLGKQANLAGKDDWESFEIDMVIDTFHDLRIALLSYWFEANEEEKEKKRETVLNETVPFYLSRFDDLVNENDGYLANGTLSWGDIYFIAASGLLIHLIGHDFFETYENLNRLRENVYAIPQIKKWLETRPETVF